MQTNQPQKKLYNCRVRLGGLTHHEVPKFAVTDKEIILLRTLHGIDAVVGIKSCGADSRTDQEELQRLAGFYGAEVVEKVFQYKMQDLTLIVEDTEEEDIEPDPAPIAELFEAPEIVEVAVPAEATENKEPVAAEAKPAKVGAAALSK